MSLTLTTQVLLILRVRQLVSIRRSLDCRLALFPPPCLRCFCKPIPNPHWIDTYTELEAMVTSMGMILEPAELYDMLKEADEDGNEEIDFDEFSKVVSNAVKRIAEDPESRGKSFAGLIMRKAKTGPAMHWRTDKHGPNLSLSTIDGSMASPLLRRDADGGKAEVNQNGHAAGHWGVQLLDMRLSTAQYGLASVLLEVESSSASFMVGVVGSNYNPSDWSMPLDRDKHAAGVRALDGHVFVKGSHKQHATMCRMPRKGATRCRISLDINMELLEMRITCLNSDAVTGSTADEASMANILVEGLPVEVIVAVALGPSEETQTVRVVGSSCERLPRKSRKAKDTYDDGMPTADTALSSPQGSPGGGSSVDEVAVAGTLAQ